MTRRLTPAPLSAEGFVRWGDVIELSGAPDKLINQGLCGRYHDLARLDFGDGRAGISLFDAEARQFPYTLEMVERHPDGSQAFVPLNGVPFLAVVADDADGKPINLHAFLTGPGQSINLHRNTWHGVLAPIGARGHYAVIDRIGDGPNLEEYWFDQPITIDNPNSG